MHPSYYQSRTPHTTPHQTEHISSPKFVHSAQPSTNSELLSSRKLELSQPAEQLSELSHRSKQLEPPEHPQYSTEQSQHSEQLEKFQPSQNLEQSQPFQNLEQSQPSQNSEQSQPSQNSEQSDEKQHRLTPTTRSSFQQLIPITQPSLNQPINLKLEPTNQSTTTTTSHFTRSILTSTTTKTLLRASKFSLATINTNALILVPSNGQPLTVAPINNISTMPLYRFQPFLSPISTNTNSNNSTRPNTPHARISALLFPNRQSNPFSPITTNNPTNTTATNIAPYKTTPPLLQLIQKFVILMAKQTKHFIAHTKSTKTTTKTGSQPHTSQQKEGRLARLMKPFNLRANEKLLTQAEKTIMFSDHYCCFAIPLYNTGIYSILAQFTIFGFVFGILSFSAPSILAIVLDFIYTALFGILCLLVGSIQALGFYGVYKEKPSIFKKYFIGNVALLGLTFIYSLILLIISSTKHQTAIDQCLLQFVSNEEFLDGPSSASQQVCNVWTYAQLGVCYFVWLLFCASQVYFCYMVKIWGQDQKLDHIRYQSIISAVRQSQAASTLHPGLSEGGEGDEWESQSRAGSLDIRSSAYSGQSNHRNGKPLLNGGSRLKNEIEWKEIDPAILNDDYHHQHDQPSDLPVPTTPQQPSSSSSSSSASRKQKFKELTPHDTNYYQQQQQHISSSHSPSSSSNPRLQHHGKSPRLESKEGSGHWIEVIDEPLSSPNRPLADDQHDHAAYYSDSQQQVDDREYYRSKPVS